MNNWKLLFFVFLIIGCESIKDEDLTVIDNVKLGVPYNGFVAELDSLDINRQNFYTKTSLNQSDALYNQINTYVTDIFNSSKYSSKYTYHYGLYYPVQWNGNKNITGLNVLLVHTEDAIDFSSEPFFNFSKSTGVPAIDQNISVEQIDDIANMLSKNYGPPIDSVHSFMPDFYVIEGSDIKGYHGKPEDKGDLLTWKTKYLTIKFFKGIPSWNCEYKSFNHSYFFFFDQNSNRQMDYSKGERKCNIFSFISYNLNDETVTKLKLDKTAL